MQLQDSHFHILIPVGYKLPVLALYSFFVLLYSYVHIVKYVFCKAKGGHYCFISFIYQLCVPRDVCMVIALLLTCVAVTLVGQVQTAIHVSIHVCASLSLRLLYILNVLHACPCMYWPAWKYAYTNYNKCVYK